MAIEHYGKDAQILKAVEELNELAVELMHYRDGKCTEFDVRSELIDVLIMCEQMGLIFDEKGMGYNAGIARRLYDLQQQINQDELEEMLAGAHGEQQ
jgi:hypothetical protein